MPYLVTLTGPYAGEIFEIKNGRTTVGRGPGCDLVLDQDAAISRAHAVLVSAGSVVRVQDAGSSHGVFVNGRRTVQGLLRTGDCVQFGASAFLVQPVPAQVSQRPRLRMIRARSIAAPGLAPREPTISSAAACLYILLAILAPVPFGLLIAGMCLRKTDPANQRFGGACLLISMFSLVVQLAIGGILVWRLFRYAQPLVDPLRQLGL